MDQKMNHVNYPFYEFRDGIFEINEFDCVSVFVVVGDKEALVIDTGVGIGDLDWFIRNRITDKPYTVVLSHNHGDHMGGAGWFDTVWMNPADLNYMDSTYPPTLEFRRRYASIIREGEGKHYDYSINRDILPWPGTPVILPLMDGQVFDLGGRTVTACNCPGHTAGEMVFIDDKTRTLLCGDACSCDLFLSGKIGADHKECIQISLDALKRIAALKDSYDFVFNSHLDFRGFGSSDYEDMIPNLIELMEQILRDQISFEEIPDPLADGGGKKLIAKYKNVAVSLIL